MNSRKLIHLECARGLASIIVIFHHFTLAFYPSIKANFASGGLRQTPLYLFLNGAGAVTFFFMLSGFVLTQRFFQKPDVAALTASVIKRLPRLMLPASVSIFAGLLILLYSHYEFKEAAAISHSAWLENFGGNISTDFIPSLADAARQCLYVFLLPGNFYYNSNLWTMMSEYYGSLIVFAISGISLFAWARTGRRLILIHLVLMIALVWLNTAFVPFIAGSLISYLTATGQMKPDLSARTTMLLVAGMAIGFSSENLVFVTTGSACALIILLGNRTLADHLSGRLGIFLGALSFPLYLVHTLVIMSLSSDVFVPLFATTGLMPALWITLAITLLASLLFALPLVWLDSAWTRWINAIVRKLVAFVAGMLGKRSVNAT